MGANVITRVLIREKGKQGSVREEVTTEGQNQREKSEDLMLLSWKVERGPQARECGKPLEPGKDRKRLSLEPPGKNRLPRWHY